MKTLSILTLTLALFTACQSEATLPQVSNNAFEVPTHELLHLNNKNITLPDNSSQLLFVQTKGWNDKKGTLQRYERVEESNAWRKVGKEIAVIIGRNGLGWGKGLHKTPKNAKYIKKEGDGKAPAGLFTLGNGFGYSDFNISFPYVAYQRTDHCVDDSHSKWYNKIVDSTTIKKDYKSFEHMKLTNHLYKYGITVNHNSKQIKDAGSCIFMHIRSGNGKGTAGCTAMKESEIMTILKWLDKKKKPLLLQLPQEEIETTAL